MVLKTQFLLCIFWTLEEPVKKRSAQLRKNICVKCFTCHETALDKEKLKKTDDSSKTIHYAFFNHYTNLIMWAPLICSVRGISVSKVGQKEKFSNGKESIDFLWTNDVFRTEQVLLIHFS